MNHIKKFEKFNSFDNVLTNEGINLDLYYYSCDECDDIWKDEQECIKCKSCGSNEFEELNSEEWDELNKMRL
jgi:hypothetical protein